MVYGIWFSKTSPICYSFFIIAVLLQISSFKLPVRADCPCLGWKVGESGWIGRVLIRIRIKVFYFL